MLFYWAKNRNYTIQSIGNIWIVSITFGVHVHWTLFETNRFFLVNAQKSLLKHIFSVFRKRVPDKVNIRLFSMSLRWYIYRKSCDLCSQIQMSVSNWYGLGNVSHKILWAHAAPFLRNSFVKKSIGSNTVTFFSCFNRIVTFFLSIFRMKKMFRIAVASFRNICSSYFQAAELRFGLLAK